MKRLVCIIAILFTAGCIALAETPPVLTFSDTRLVPGMSKKELEKKVREWYFFKGSEAENYVDYLLFAIRDSPHIAQYGRKKTSTVTFEFFVVCRDNSYTANITKIDSLDPYLGRLFGNNGRLFTDLYTNRQLKKSTPVIYGLFDLSAEMFAEFAKYMGVK